MDELGAFILRLCLGTACLACAVTLIGELILDYKKHRDKIK